MANRFVIEVRTKGFEMLEAQMKKADAASKSFDNTQGKLRGTTSGLRRTIGALRNSLLLYTFAIAGATKGVSSLLQASSRFESLRTRLVGLTGSVKEANQAFNLFNQVAATTPFALDDVVEAGAQLEAFGADATALIKPITDLAAFMGTTAVEAANSFGRAFAGGAGAADILRERGILNIIKTTQGLSDLSKTTLPEFRAALINTLQDPVNGIAGSTDRLSKTFEGAMSNMRDNITRLSASLGTSLKEFLQLDRLLPNIGDSARKIAEEIDFLNDPIQNLERRLNALGVASDVLGNIRLRSEIQKTRKEIASQDQEIMSLVRTLSETDGVREFFVQATTGASAFGINLAGAQKQLEFVGQIFQDTGGILSPFQEGLLLASKNLKVLISEAQKSGDASTFKTLTEQLENVTKILGLMNIESKQDPIAEMLPDMQVFDIFEDALIDMRNQQADDNDAFKQQMKERAESFGEFVDFAVDNEGFVLESMEKSLEGMEGLTQAMRTALLNANKEIQEKLAESSAITEFDKAIRDIDKSGRFALRTFEKFGDAFAEAALTATSFEDAAKKAIRSIAAEIVSKAGTFLLLKSFFAPQTEALTFGKFLLGSLGIKHDGGQVQKFQSGGMVQGRDNVPILAQAGEFVIKRESAQSIGLDTLNQMNQTGIAPKSINIIIQGGIVDQDYVANTLIPAINASGEALA